MDWSPVDRLLDEIVSTGASPGVAAGCWARGRQVYQGKAGRLSSEPSERPVEMGTVFDLASLTKALCTAPLLWLRFQKGEWTPSDSLYKFFPELRSESQGGITLGQLLSHCSGYPAVVHMEQMGANGAEGAYHLTKFTKLEARPGTVSRYSDVGYLVLGHLLEKTSGKRLDELFSNEIAGPLGIRAPAFRPNGVGPGVPEGIASTSTPEGFLRPLSGVVEDENTRFLGGVSGAAGLFGNIEQVGALLLEFRKAWSGDGGLFTRKTLDSMWQVVPQPAGNTWTCGWDTPSDGVSTAGRYFSLSSVGHLGFVGTSIWYDRKNDVIAVVLSNRVNPVRSNTKFNPFRARIHDAMMETLSITELRPRRYT